MKPKLFPFDAVVSDVTSKFSKIKNEDYLEHGSFPIIDQGQEFIGGYTDDDALVTSDIKPAIVFGDHTRVFKYCDFPFAIGADGVKVLQVDSEIAHSKYVFYFLKSLEIKSAGYSRHFKFLKEAKIPLPPLDEQIRIATILGKAEALIAQRKQSLALLNDLVKSTFLDMFGDPFVNSKSWVRKEIKDVGKVITGTTPASAKEGMFGGSIPFITPGDLESDQPYKRFVTKDGALNSRTVREGATLVCCIGATIGKVDRAKTFSALNQQINAIEWNNEVSDLYGEALMKFMKPLIISKGSSSTLPILNKGDFEKIKIIVPLIKLQNEFARIVEKVESLKVVYTESLNALVGLYGSLSQRAFKGELEGRVLSS